MEPDTVIIAECDRGRCNGRFPDQDVYLAHLRAIHSDEVREVCASEPKQYTPVEVLKEADDDSINFLLNNDIGSLEELEHLGPVRLMSLKGASKDKLDDITYSYFKYRCGG